MDRTCYAITNPLFPVTASLISTDSGSSVYCECRPTNLLFLQGATTAIECVLKMLRCPSQQKLEVALDIN